MIKQTNFETYLYISKNTFNIFVYEKINRKNLYNENLKVDEQFNFQDLNNLSKFLDDNIFKIEKLIGMFVKNIVLIIHDNKVANLNFGIKKKNYQETISKKFLESILIDAKDLFKESYQNQKIMHLIIKKYIIDGNQHLLFDDNLSGDNFCVELKFISIPNNFQIEIDKVLEKYQIEIIQYFDGSYIKTLFKDEDVSLPEMIYKVQNGFIENEVKLIPKNLKKFGFFEKFFQLFS